MSGPPDFLVAEVALEPDATTADTLEHLRQYTAALPVALDGLVSMWDPNGWHGSLDGRPVPGNLDRFDDASEGGIIHSAGIERHGSWTLQVTVFCNMYPRTVKVTAQAMSHEQAERIAQAAADAWSDPPPLPTRSTRLERAGRRDTRLWAAWVSVRRAIKPTGFVGGLVSGVLVGALLAVLGVTGTLEGAVRWLIGL